MAVAGAEIVSVLGVYVTFVLPAIALLMGWGAVLLTKADARRFDEEAARRKSAEPEQPQAL